MCITCCMFCIQSYISHQFQNSVSSLCTAAIQFMYIQRFSDNVLYGHSRIQGRIWVLKYHLHFLSVWKHIYINALLFYRISICINNDLSFFIVLLSAVEQNISIKNDMTIRQAMSELVKQAGENDNISTLYVVDENEHFYGAIDLKDLIIARAEESLESLIVRSYPYVTDREQISDCIDRIVDYAERSLPVLNDAGKLVGIITSSDVVELVDDELGDDYAKLGGLTGEEDLNENVFESVKKRLPWLIALLFLGMLVSSVVGAFESVVAVLPVVICFQSMVLDMAGNVGTQSLAVTIRVLVDENLTLSKKLQLLWKETRVGLLNGAILAVMALGFLGCYIHFFKGYVWTSAFLLSGCVGLSLIVSMVISSLVGTLIPMLFHKIHIDPAVASGPLITTINDLVAVVVYYGLAMVVLIDLFHLA